MITHTTFQLTERISCLSANHETDRPALAAIWGDRGTLVVDAGNSPTHALLMLDMLAQRQAANKTAGSSTENHACSHTNSGISGDTTAGMLARFQSISLTEARD